MKTPYSLFFFLLASFTSFGQGKSENLKIIWPEEYRWALVSEKNDSTLQTAEGILQKDSGDYKTLKETSILYKNVNKIPMGMAMNMMLDQVKTDAPKAVLTTLERDDKAKHPWALFKIEIPRFKNDKNPESRLYYILQGGNSLYVHFISIKEKTLPSDFIQKWGKVFKDGEITYQN